MCETNENDQLMNELFGNLIAHPQYASELDAETRGNYLKKMWMIIAHQEL